MRDYVVENHKPEEQIVIYGAGVYGELCLRALEQAGICVYAFADRRTDLDEYFGKKVIRPEEIKTIENVSVLIASKEYIKQIVDFLKAEKVNNYYCITSLLETEWDENKLSFFAKRERQNIYQYGERLAHFEKPFFCINNVDLVLSEVCNLKCRDCGSLIPYYKRPCHFEMDKIIFYFDRFLQAVDSLTELRLLGGETFLYPELVQLVEYYTNHEKVEQIVIYTNAVIRPKQEVMSQLPKDKLLIRISNYGELSKNVESMVADCKEYKIDYEVSEAMIWRDMGGVGRRNYTEDQCREIYEKCDNARCPSFHKGKLYVCPRAGHGEELGLFKNGPDEYLDFTMDGIDYREHASRIEDLLYNRKLFEACYYCNGCNRWAKGIPAAIQVQRGIDEYDT